MMTLKMLTKTISVTSQLQPGDMEQLAAQGFRSVVCNRPDGEGADQPGFAELEEAARKHGLSAAYLPVVSGKYECIYGLGDACNAPNTKTAAAAAARKQAPIVAHNLLKDLGAIKAADAVYDGYGSCPLTVERGRIVLAEFGYGSKLLPSFPSWLIDGQKPSRLAWILKERMLPFVYWKVMLRGREWMASPNSSANLMPLAWRMRSIPARIAGQPTHRRLAWICLALLPLAAAAPAQTPDTRRPDPIVIAGEEPITPIPQAPAADPLKLALGERLFGDRRLSHEGTLACSSCHDIHTNGADDGRRTTGRNGSRLPLNIPTLFNAALSFRLNWEGNFRTLEAQAQSSLENPAIMGTSVDEVLKTLRADPKVVGQFNDAYGGGPDRAKLLDAIATYERSLLTPGGRFDRWLGGDTAALAAEEQNGYRLFKSLGCVSCHQGVNVGGNLYQRHGIFRPLASPKPEVLRVPSLRNVATTAPYFHDGSTPTLGDAVRKMAAAQLDLDISDQEIHAIVAFLKTLTGNYRGAPVVAAPP